jgi:esterase/lipase superfamily enzyme
MATPNLYLGQDDNPFADVPPVFQSNKVDILYVTDRKPLETKDGSVRYGHQRSTSMAFGSCVIEFGKDITWPVLVENSRKAKRSVSLSLKTAGTTEHARFPSTPLSVVSTVDGLELDPKETFHQKQIAAKLRADVAGRLKNTKTKEAFVYLHGFNNTFEDTVFVGAELWHFLGRRGVPIVYSWPAKQSLFGYGYDRESSEFTVFHFKQFLRAIAGCPGLEKIHILAHSRGTDVAASAFRELVISANASPKSVKMPADSPGLGARNVLDKVGNVVLAAADIDMEVASQRLVAEMTFMSAERVTIYLSHDDKALNLAVWLFESIGRLGELSLRIFSPDHVKTLETIDRIDFIDARVDTGFMGHAYFHSSPAVSSDLILLLRDNLSPGAGRPLTCDERTTRYWSIGKNYPYAYDK